MAVISQSLQKMQLRQELLQMLFRLGITFVTANFLTYEHFFHGYFSEETYALFMFLHLFFVNLIALYIFLLQKNPYLFQRERILVIIFFEVIATTYVMYLAGDLSAYFAWLYLWFVVAYGMRYGGFFGYITFMLAFSCWSVLIFFSPYWQEHLEVAIGWLITLVVISVYFFTLSNQLHQTIGKLHQNVDEVSHRATHDSLTALPNRALFALMLEEYKHGFKKEQKQFALIFIDLDNFKQINDAFGHEVGDRVLLEAAKRIVSSESFSARIGGDEFVSLLHFKTKDELKKRVETLVAKITQMCQKKEITLSASIGIALYPDDAQNISELKTKADMAMYRAKKLGKNRFCFYEDNC